MKTAEEIKAIAQNYFDECDATRERVTLKNGEITYYQIPYTMAGLCARLHVTKTEMEKIRQGTAAAKRKKTECAWYEALAWAAGRVEQHIVERALLGELNAGVAALLLKGWGYGAEETIKDAVSVTRVVLEDPENYGR